MNIPFSKVTTGQEEIDAVTRVLNSSWLAAGPETEALEQEFAEYVGVKYAIFTNSCTSALKMAYKWAKEIGVDGIIYPENTFCATYSAADEMGLRITTHQGIFYTAGIKDFRAEMVSMHYGGVKDETPCLIEDSAHRIEPNDPLIGKIRCYSFYATKNMTTGSGGMLVTNDEEIYERCRLYWKDGLSTSTHERKTKGYDYEVLTMAGGYDGNDIAAAIGRVQLQKLPSFTDRRNAIARRYNEAFGKDWQGNHLYPYGTDKGLIDFLKDKGIRAGYFYPPKGFVCLPIYPLLTDTEVQYIIDCVREYEKTKLL